MIHELWKVHFLYIIAENLGWRHLGMEESQGNITHCGQVGPDFIGWWTLRSGHEVTYIDTLEF